MVTAYRPLAPPGCWPQTNEASGTLERITHISGELSSNRSTSVLTGGGKTVDELYADQKADKKFTVFYVEGEIHYSYIGDKPSDVLDEDEPAFIPLNEEASLPNNGIKRKMKVTWDGAAQSAIKPIEDKLFVCEACAEKFKYASELAFVDESGQFSKKRDAFLTTLLIDNGMNTFSNQFRATKLVCIKCLQRMHAPEKDSIGTPYYRLEADGKITQTSKWSNAMKVTKRTKLRNRQLNIVCNRSQQRPRGRNLIP